MTRHLVVPLALAFATLVALAGCGDGDDGPAIHGMPTAVPDIELKVCEDATGTGPGIPLKIVKLDPSLRAGLCWRRGECLYNCPPVNCAKETP